MSGEDVSKIIQNSSSDSSTLMIAGGVFFVIIIIVVAIFMMGGSSDELINCINNQDVTSECKCGESKCDAGKYCSDNNCLDSAPESVDPCEGVDCGENGTCVNGSCNCNDGYSGSSCETQLEACTIEADCSNRASAVSGYKGDCDCTCNDHFHGESCLETDPVNFGDVSPDLVETGETGDLQCVAGTYEDVVNTTCSLCPSDGFSTSPKSIAGRNKTVLDCRCSDVNGVNNYYYDMTSGNCQKCPTDMDNTGAVDDFSRIVSSINDSDNPITGTVDDCKCSLNTGWHETTDSNGDRSCVKCQGNSTWDPIQRICVCDEGYLLQGEGTSAVCQPDTRCLNACGIYDVQTDAQGEVYDSNGLKVVNGLKGGSFQIDHENSSDILMSDGKYGETFKRTNQFQCSVEAGAGKCYFKKDSSSARQACGSSTSGWMEDCSRCKEGFKLTFNNLLGFDCLPDICGDGTNIGCFDQTEYNSVIHQDDKDWTTRNVSAGSLCRSSDPNEPLSSNVCDVTSLNTERNSGTPSEYRFTENRFTNTGGTTKIKCGISGNVREDGKCVHVEDFCAAHVNDNLCKNGSKCVNLDIEPKYDCIDPANIDTYNRAPGPNEYNPCPRSTGDDGKEYLGYQCHIPNSDICLKGEMTDAGKKRLKKQNDMYGGIETNKIDTLMYDSTYSGSDDKKITKVMGTNDTDATNYECDCAQSEGEGLNGIAFGTDGGRNPSSRTFCRCPEDDAVSDLEGAPFYSFKPNEVNSDGQKIGLDGIKCYVDCAKKENGSSMESTLFGDKNYLSGKYFKITDAGGRKSLRCEPCNDKGMNQVKISNEDGTTKTEYLGLDFTNAKSDLCKPAYEGYYGTTERKTDTTDGQGGEQIGGGTPRRVKEGYLPRRSDDDCLAWTPENIYKPFCGDFTIFPSAEDNTALLTNIGWPEWGGGYERQPIRYNERKSWQAGNLRNSDITTLTNNYNTHFKTACETVGNNMFVGEILGGKTFSGTPAPIADPEGWRNPGATGSISFSCNWS